MTGGGAVSGTTSEGMDEVEDREEVDGEEGSGGTASKWCGRCGTAGGEVEDSRSG